MSLATLCLAIFLILTGISLLGWVAISSTVLGLFALAAGVLYVLEAVGLFSYSLPHRHV